MRSSHLGRAWTCPSVVPAAMNGVGRSWTPRAELKTAVSAVRICPWPRRWERSGLLASGQLDDAAAADVEEVARAIGSAPRRSLGQTVPHLAVVIATTVVALEDHGIRTVALDAAVLAHGSRVVRRPRHPTTSRR